VTADAQQLRLIELGDVEAMLRDVSQDYETMRTGVRQSQAQLDHLRKTGPSPDGPALLTNAPGVCPGGSPPPGRSLKP
jgi:hypothetical protein